MGDSREEAPNYTVGEGGVRVASRVASGAWAGLRLDQALAQWLPGESRTRLAQLVNEGQVTVDGERVLPRRRLRGGERIVVALAPRPQERAQQPEARALDIVHEDDHVIVIAKPAGLVVHPGAGNWEGTLLNALLHHAPGLAALPRAGIVHRLDKDTSGLMVVAKTESAMQALVRDLAAHAVSRTYLALVRGKVRAAGTVDAPIGRHPVRRTHMAVVRSGKPAVTHYRVVERFEARTLLQCDLETGRTHQIRVHLASLGHPIEGDATYGGRAGERLLPRQALHAWRLAFAHPHASAPVRFEAPLPEDFAGLLVRLRQG